MSHLFNRTGESSSSSEKGDKAENGDKSSTSSIKPDTSPSTGRVSSTKSVTFSSDIEIREFNDSMNTVSEENELKIPLGLLGSYVEKLDKRMDKLDKRMDKLEDRMTDGFERIESRLDRLFGKNKDNVSTGFERNCEKWLQKRNKGRQFERNYMLECPEEEYKIEELDIYSEPRTQREPHILAECTLRLHDRKKILQCARKRDIIARVKNINKSDITAYIMAMAINAELDEELRKLAETYQINLQLF